MQIIDHVTNAAEAIAAARLVVEKRRRGLSLKRPAAKIDTNGPISTFDRDWLIVASKPAELIETNRRILFPHCLAVVVAVSGVSEDLILGKRRFNAAKYPRQVLAWLARRYTKLSYTQLAEKMDRDHTTLVHAVHVVSIAAEGDPRHDLARRAEAALLERYG